MTRGKAPCSGSAPGCYGRVGTWCEGAGQDGNTQANSTDTVSVDFSKLTCPGADLTQLQRAYFYLQPGTFNVDHLRAE